MQFVSDGPDVPSEVLLALENGELALFCGAGVSVRAGLPTFNGLVQKVVEELGTTLTAPETLEFQKLNYDRVFSSLESEGRFEPRQVRAAVRQVLSAPPSAVVDSHKAIIELSTDRDGRLHLVTTNFDLLFESADPNIRHTAAPLLPVPKPPKWDKLVYLHGRLSNDDPEGQHLVLSSGDYGTAYLLERWASRFVSELFNHCAVLFIGYSVEDPVMRYLVDAIAAERKTDKRIHRAFAFVGCKISNWETEKQKWMSKNITPIIYDDSQNHDRLHGTLKAWGGIWAGGLSSKLNIVQNTAPKDPASLAEETIQQLCWALGDSSGAMARTLAKIGTRATLDWLPIFEKYGLLSGPHGAQTPKVIPLVDDGSVTQPPPRLDNVRKGLAVWLAEHMENPNLARWVITKGSFFHPEFRMCVEWKMDGSTSLGISLKRVWIALLQAAHIRFNGFLYSPFIDSDLVASETPGPILRSQIRILLSPRLVFRPAWGSVEIEEADENSSQKDPELTVSSIASFDCELAANQFLTTLLDKLGKRSDWQEVLSDLAFDIAGLLRDALDLQATVDAASNDHDYSFIHHPSIAPHEQNRGFHSWTMLIDLSRDAIDDLALNNPRRAKALVQFWAEIRYPTFRRLILYSANAYSIPEVPEIFELMKSDPDNWIWSVSTQVEFFAYLPTFWTALSNEDRADFGTLLSRGPSRAKYRSEIPDQEWEELRSRVIWARLSRLNRDTGTLTSELAELLKELEARYPTWQVPDQRRGDFPSWIETSWGLPSDFSAAELSEMSDDDLLATVIEHERNREGLIDAWREMAKFDGKRTISLCEQLIARGFKQPQVFAAAMNPFREEIPDRQIQERLLVFLSNLPDEILCHESFLRTSPDILKALSKSDNENLQVGVLSIWDREFEASLLLEMADSSDSLFDAINHPAGMLAEVVAEMLRFRSIERGQGIPIDLRGRLERITGAPGKVPRLGRTILASRLPYLFDLDPKWSRQHLLPFFSWEDFDEARSAWQGFLWSPWLRPSLWADLKVDFLETFNHLESLGKSVTNIGALLASVAIYGEGALSVSESRMCLASLDTEGRESVVIWLQSSLEGAGEQAHRLWTDKIGPWIFTAWPREPRYRSKAVSERLVAAAIASDQSFDEAVDAINEIIGPIEHGHGILDDLRKKNLSSTHPQAALTLVNIVTPDQPPQWFGHLSEFLADIRCAAPDLESTPEYTRLKQISIANDL